MTGKKPYHCIPFIILEAFKDCGLRILKQSYLVDKNWNSWLESVVIIESFHTVKLTKSKK